MPEFGLDVFVRSAQLDASLQRSTGLAGKQGRAFDTLTDQVSRSSRAMGGYSASAKTASTSTAAVGRAASRSSRSTDTAAQSMGRLTRRTNAQARANGLLDRSVLKILRSFLLTTVAALSLHAAVSQLRTGIRVFAEYEHALKGVEAVSGATTSQMQRLEAQSRSLGESTEFTASQVVGAQLAFARAGFAVQEVLDVMPAALDLATSGQLTLARAAEISAVSIRTFSLRAQDMPMVADVFASAAASALTDVNQMGEAFKFVAPVAAAFGQSLEVSAAAAAALANRGLQASMAGTGLKKVLSELAAPSALTRKEFKRVGIALEDLNPRIHSLTAILPHLNMAMERGAEFLEIFGQRGGPAAINLAAMHKEVAKLTKEFQTADAPAAAMAKTIRDTLKQEFLVLAAVIESLRISFGEGLAPQLRKTVTALSDFFRDGGAGAKQFGENVGSALDSLAKILMLVVDNLGLLSAAFKGLLAVQVMKWVTLAVTWFTGLGGAGLLAAVGISTTGKAAGVAAVPVGVLTNQMRGLNAMMLGMGASGSVAAKGIAGASLASQRFLALGITPLTIGLGALLAVVLLVRDALKKLAAQAQQDIEDMASGINQFTDSLEEIRQVTVAAIESKDLQQMSNALAGFRNQEEALIKTRERQLATLDDLIGLEDALQRERDSTTNVVSLQRGPELMQELRDVAEAQDEAARSHVNARTKLNILRGEIDKTIEALRAFVVVPVPKVVDEIDQSITRLKDRIAAMTEEAKGFDVLASMAIRSVHGFEQLERAQRAEQQVRIQSLKLTDENRHLAGELEVAILGVAAASERLAGSKVIGSLSTQLIAQEKLTDAYSVGRQEVALTTRAMELERQQRSATSKAATEQIEVIAFLVASLAKERQEQQQLARVRDLHQETSDLRLLNDARLQGVGAIEVTSSALKLENKIRTATKGLVEDEALAVRTLVRERERESLIGAGRQDIAEIQAEISGLQQMAEVRRSNFLLEEAFALALKDANTEREVSLALASLAVRRQAALATVTREGIQSEAAYAAKLAEVNNEFAIQAGLVEEVIRARAELEKSIRSNANEFGRDIGREFASLMQDLTAAGARMFDEFVQTGKLKFDILADFFRQQFFKAIEAIIAKWAATKFALNATSSGSDGASSAAGQGLSSAGGAAAVIGAFIIVFQMIDGFIKSAKTRDFRDVISIGGSGALAQGGTSVTGGNIQEAEQIRLQMKGLLQDVLDSIGGFVSGLPEIGIKIRNDGEKFQALLNGIVIGTFTSFREAFNQATLAAVRQADFSLVGKNVARVLANSTATSLEQFLSEIDFAKTLDVGAASEMTLSLRELGRWIDQGSKKVAQLGLSIQDWGNLVAQEVARLGDSIRDEIAQFLPGFDAIGDKFAELRQRTADYNAGIEENIRLLLLKIEAEARAAGVTEETVRAIVIFGQGMHQFLTEMGEDVQFRDVGAAILNALRSIGIEGDRAAANLESLLAALGGFQGQLIDPALIDQAEKEARRRARGGAGKQRRDAIAQATRDIELLSLAAGGMSDAGLDLVRQFNDLEDWVEELRKLGFAEEQLAAVRRDTLALMEKDLLAGPREIIARANETDLETSFRALTEKYQELFEQAVLIATESATIDGVLNLSDFEEAFGPMGDILDEAFGIEALELFRNEMARLISAGDIDGLMNLASIIQEMFGDLPPELVAAMGPLGEAITDLIDDIISAAADLGNVKRQPGSGLGGLAESTEIEAQRTALEQTLRPLRQVARGLGEFQIAMEDLGVEYDDLRAQTIAAAFETEELAARMKELARLEKSAASSLALDFIGSLEQLGISLPIAAVLQLAEAEFNHGKAMALSTILTLQASGALEGLAISFETVLGAILGAQFDPGTVLGTGAGGGAGSGEDLESVKNQVLAILEGWRRLPLGELTREAIDLREVLNQVTHDANRAGVSLELVNRRFQIALDTFIDDALSPFENLDMSELDRELMSIQDRFVDIILALQTAGASTADMARVQTAFASAMEDFIHRATSGIRSLLDELRADPSVTGPPGTTFATARDRFASLVEAARGGDLEALSQVEAAARALLQQGESFLGGGVGMREFIREIMEGLEGLGTDLVPADIALLQEQVARLGRLITISEAQPSADDLSGAAGGITDAIGDGADGIKVAILDKLLEIVRDFDLVNGNIDAVISVLSILSQRDDLTSSQIDTMITGVTSLLAETNLTEGQLASLSSVINNMLTNPLITLDQEQRDKLQDILEELQTQTKDFQDFSGLDSGGLGGTADPTIAAALTGVLVWSKTNSGNTGNLVSKARDRNARLRLINQSIDALPDKIQNAMSQSLPGFQHGGDVADTGLAFLHAGERVLSPLETKELRSFESASLSARRAQGTALSLQRAIPARAMPSNVLPFTIPPAPPAEVVSAFGGRGGSQGSNSAIEALHRIEVAVKSLQESQESTERAKAQLTIGGMDQRKGMQSELEKVNRELERLREQISDDDNRTGMTG